MPNLFAGISRTTRTADTQHQCLDVIVLADLLQCLDDFRTYNSITIFVGDNTFQV